MISASSISAQADLGDGRAGGSADPLPGLLCVRRVGGGGLRHLEQAIATAEVAEHDVTSMMISMAGGQVGLAGSGPN